ncbi:uncharacterized protein MEPE_04436 [Melanopsichium pennsylvanicum]|uniref:Prokaryotic-type class I peptide chain release factors domain-containing protein n=2 Tax=Melanopsichium pennsylvanicum TaxID=63383 RepID=A0AAJ5C6D2_9BASI|nr:conserved hypothetical protein [Melanopsichium pennsylvanicum 4]SNX85727.1 uncharacterized protein MEPE_04436 [Melanopsichium pennsylvanicum]
MWSRAASLRFVLSRAQVIVPGSYAVAVSASRAEFRLVFPSSKSLVPISNSFAAICTSSLRHDQDKALEYDQEEMKQRRRWIATFEPLALRRNDFQVTFSRSSGPGGQNVNKLNTKANVRLDLSQTSSHASESLDPSHPLKWLTRDLVSRIAKNSPYYVASDHSLLFTSMRHRTQEANVQDALEKMHAHLLDLAQHGLVGETSKQQRDRVRRLQDADARRKKNNKIKRADVKSGRKFKG